MAYRKTYFIFLLFLLVLQSVGAAVVPPQKVVRILKKSVLQQAEWALAQAPITITSFASPRSAGGIHDFFSEGDYWWPTPANPTGPYIQKDGLTNPNNFTEHRKAMIRFSQVIGTLTSAYQITKDQRYVRHAVGHLNAWFVDTATYMNPSLLYAQAIQGKVTGRSIGIIDMMQMAEVAQGVRVLERASALTASQVQPIKNWFSSYLRWVTTHPYGIEERDTKNNHATCWVLQVAVFARLVGDQSLLSECKLRYKTILLPNQLDLNGSFPLELKRSKAYGYSLFNLDAFAGICQVLSDSADNLWEYRLADGRSIRTAIEFMYPFVEQKANWPYAPDVMFWNDWPVAQPFLLFGSLRFRQKNMFNCWRKGKHTLSVDEVVRNMPMRNHLIWLEAI